MYVFQFLPDKIFYRVKSGFGKQEEQGVKDGEYGTNLATSKVSNPLKSLISGNLSIL